MVIKNPFFLLAPDWAMIPLFILATLATVIASQAVISGVFSFYPPSGASGIFVADTHHLLLIAVLLLALLCLDVPMFAANALKIFSGGWLPPDLYCCWDS